MKFTATLSIIAKKQKPFNCPPTWGTQNTIHKQEVKHADVARCRSLRVVLFIEMLETQSVGRKTGRLLGVGGGARRRRQRAGGDSGGNGNVPHLHASNGYTTANLIKNHSTCDK